MTPKSGDGFPPSYATYETVSLEILRHVFRNEVDVKEMNLREGNARFDVLRTGAGSLVMSVAYSFLAGSKTSKEVASVSWPADWWQAVRARWFPKWWLRRWPVRYEHRGVVFEILNVCPHVDVSDGRRHFQFLTRKES